MSWLPLFPGPLTPADRLAGHQDEIHAAHARLAAAFLETGARGRVIKGSPTAGTIGLPVFV